MILLAQILLMLTALSCAFLGGMLYQKGLDYYSMLYGYAVINAAVACTLGDKE